MSLTDEKGQDLFQHHPPSDPHPSSDEWDKHLSDEEEHLEEKEEDEESSDGAW